MHDRMPTPAQYPNLQGGIALRAGIGMSALIDVKTRQELRTVPAFDNSLVLIVEGTKEIGRADGIVRLQADSYLTLRAESQVDIGNVPSSISGRYRAIALSFAKETLQAFAKQYPRPFSRELSENPWQGLAPHPALKESVLHAHRGMQDACLPDEVLRHRLIEVLLQLAEHGFCWPLPGKQTNAERVRLLLSSRPGAPWSAADAALALGISESALRRRLAGEATCFRDILSDIRLSTGLLMLQTTSQSIAEIALACGYESPSRFAEKFQARFGTLPSQLRGD